MTPDEAWADSRLDAAFRGAFDREPPASLGGQIAEALRPGPSRSARSRLVGWAAAAAAVAALLIVSISFLPNGDGPADSGGIGSTSSGPSGTRGPGPTDPLTTAIAWPFPDRVASGDNQWTVMTVSAAIAVRASEPAPRTIAVAGWESYATEARYCTIALPGILGQLENQCAYNRWFADVPQPSMVWYDPPILPAFRIAWDQGVGDDAIRFAGGSFPRGSHTAHVLIGHFHDALADECGAEVRDRCSATFVVTDVAWTLTLATLHAPPSEPTVEPMSVDEAIGVRDGGDSSEELAVGGWYFRGVVPCLLYLTNAQRPLEDCVNPATWLMADPERLAVRATDGSESIKPPIGAAFNLAFEVQPAAAENEPVEVIFVGHFHDPRAADCAPARRVACDRLFVVDAVLRAP